MVRPLLYGPRFARNPVRPLLFDRPTIAKAVRPLPNPVRPLLCNGSRIADMVRALGRPGSRIQYSGAPIALIDKPGIQTANNGSTIGFHGSTIEYASLTIAPRWFALLQIRFAQCTHLVRALLCAPENPYKTVR